MCDTFVALSEATANGSVIFAKNSDREPNEAHEVVHVPAAEHGPGAQVRCTYITIPQVERTNAVLLGKPYWIWGAEMGANAHGVVIGNEAVFTKLPYEKEPGLIGMDLLRLGLERADTAEAAVTVMTELLTTYGQGGNCGHTHDFRYHNSFLVADPSAGVDPGDCWPRVGGSTRRGVRVDLERHHDRGAVRPVLPGAGRPCGRGEVVRRPGHVRLRGRLQRPDLHALQ